MATREREGKSGEQTPRNLEKNVFQEAGSDLLISLPI